LVFYGFYGGFVWARWALNSPKWRFPARPVEASCAGCSAHELQQLKVAARADPPSEGLSILCEC
jgi:hypothetical protein